MIFAQDIVYAAVYVVLAVYDAFVGFCGGETEDYEFCVDTEIFEEELDSLFLLIDILCVLHEHDHSKLVCLFPRWNRVDDVPLSLAL